MPNSPMAPIPTPAWTFPAPLVSVAEAALEVALPVDDPVDDPVADAVADDLLDAALVDDELALELELESAAEPDPTFTLLSETWVGDTLMSAAFEPSLYLGSVFPVLLQISISTLRMNCDVRNVQSR